MIVWRDEPIAIVDTETLGTDVARHRVVEVAAIRSDGQRFARLVNPDTPIPPEATAIHGITDAMVAGAPTFAAVAFDLAAFVDGHLVAAYNARFDRAMLIAEYLRAGCVPPSWLHAPSIWIDVLAWARMSSNRGEAGPGRFKLGTVAARLGVELGTAHRALGDCETTGRVLNRLSAEPDLMPESFDMLLAEQAAQVASFDKFMANRALMDLRETQRLQQQHDEVA